MSRSKSLVGVGAGLAAAGVGAALGLAAERWTAGRGRSAEHVEQLGSVRGVPQTVVADDGTELYVEVDDLDVLSGQSSGRSSGRSDAQPGGRRRKGSKGEAAAPTVVFSHGFCLNQDIWHFQRSFLRGRHRMVFWDQRGHGRSSTGDVGVYTVDQCGLDLRAVIEATAPTGPIILVGHSMGGMTVMALAAQVPELIRERVVGVALVSTSSGGLADVHWGLSEALGRIAHRLAPSALAGLSRTPKLVERSRRIGSDLEQIMVRRYSYASPVPAGVVRFTAAMIAATPIDVVSAYLPTFDVHDKAEALAVLDGVEALVLSGEDDLLTPPEHSQEIVRRMPGAELVLVPDAGHMVMLEHPDDVNLHLSDLLERASRRAQHQPSR